MSDEEQWAEAFREVFTQTCADIKAVTINAIIRDLGPDYLDLVLAELEGNDTFTKAARELYASALGRLPDGRSLPRH